MVPGGLFSTVGRGDVGGGGVSDGRWSKLAVPGRVTIAPSPNRLGA